jgi:hypothetical protein
MHHSRRARRISGNVRVAKAAVRCNGRERLSGLELSVPPVRKIRQTTFFRGLKRKFGLTLGAAEKASIMTKEEEVLAALDKPRAIGIVGDHPTRTVYYPSQW